MEMKKIDLDEYIEAFDFEKDKMCYCWSCLDKDPSREVRECLSKVMTKMGVDYEPDYEIMSFIKATLKVLGTLSEEQFIAWLKEEEPRAKEFIKSGMAGEMPLSESLIVRWMSQPYATTYAMKVHPLRNRGSMFENTVEAYLLWALDIQSEIKQHLSYKKHSTVWV